MIIPMEKAGVKTDCLLPIGPTLSDQLELAETISSLMLSIY